MMRSYSPLWLSVMLHNSLKEIEKKMSENGGNADLLEETEQKLFKTGISKYSLQEIEVKMGEIEQADIKRVPSKKPGQSPDNYDATSQRKTTYITLINTLNANGLSLLSETEKNAGELGKPTAYLTSFRSNFTQKVTRALDPENIKNIHMLETVEETKAYKTLENEIKKDIKMFRYNLSSYTSELFAKDMAEVTKLVELAKKEKPIQPNSV